MSQFDSSSLALGPAHASNFLPVQPYKGMVLVEEHSCAQKLLPVYLAIEAIEHPSKAGYKMKVFIPQLYALCQEVCRYIGMRENCMWPVSLSFSSPSVEWGQAFPEPNSIMIFYLLIEAPCLLSPFV